MTANLNDLAPIVLTIGKLVGLITPQDQPNFGWFSDPDGELMKIPTARQAQLFALLRQLLGSSSAQVVGMPGGARAQEEWFPVYEDSGRTAGAYIVLRDLGAAGIELGVGGKWTPSAKDPRAAVWVQLPLISVGAAIKLVLGTAAGPVRIAAELAPKDPLGDPAHFKFAGVRLTGDIVFDAIPELALVLTQVEIPGQPKADRALLQLAEPFDKEDIRGLIEIAVAVVVAEIKTLCKDSPVLKAHLLPLVGLTGTPRLELEKLVDDELEVFTRWLRALTGNPSNVATWLAHLLGLLTGDPGMPSLPSFDVPALPSGGTRSDPWAIPIPLGNNVTLTLTAAREQAAGGGDLLYPGLRVASPGFNFGGGTSLAFEAALEVAAIPLSGAARARALTAFQAGGRLFDAMGPLVSHDFTGDATLGPLGSFQVGDLQAGLRLGAGPKLLPVLELHNVHSKLGDWPRVDLDNLDGVLQGLGGAASGALVQGLLNQLGAQGTSPGARVAALLGLIAPPSLAQGWPVALPIVTELLADPLAAIARYHGVAVKSVYAGASAWRVLLDELAALLSAGPIAGTGTVADPWRVALASGPAGAADLVVSAVVVGATAQLRVALQPAPTPTQLGGGATLALRGRLRLLDLDLPTAPGSAAVAAWLPGADVSLRLAGAGPLALPDRAGFGAQIDGAQLDFAWKRGQDPSWGAQVDNLKISVAGVPGLQTVAAQLRFDPASGLPVPDLAALAAPLRLILGRYLVESGPLGLGFAALCGLLPNTPGLQLGLPGVPALAASPLRLPADWPQLPLLGAGVFTDPWPTLRDHLRKLLLNPAWALPALRWLGGALARPQLAGPGAIGLPDFTLPNLALPSLALPQLPLASVPLPDLSLADLGWGRSDWQNPFEIGGRGSVDEPWYITLARGPARAVQGLAWLEPAGPPRGAVLDALLSLLPDNLKSLVTGAGTGTLNVHQLLQLLRVLGAADAGLQSALQAVPLAEIEAGLTLLQPFLDGSDGLAAVTSQQPVSPGWEPASPAPVAAHWDQLTTPAVIQQIADKLTLYNNGTAQNLASASNPFAVVFLGAPWQGADAWYPTLQQLGVASPAAIHHFQVFAPGTDPKDFDLGQVVRDAAGPLYFTATLAVVNSAPEVAPQARMVPVTAAANTPSQAKQVLDIVDRVRSQTGNKPVILVAHSSAGLAARAAVATEGGTKIKGLVTVGTPHGGGAVPWLVDQGASQALRLLDRLDPAMVSAAPFKDLLPELLGFLRGTPVQGAPLQATTFTPPGPATLPAAFKAHAIASKLPATGLRPRLDAWLKSKIDALRQPAGGQTAPTHLGLGVRVALPAAVQAGVRVETTARLDIARLPLTNAVVDTTAYPAVPRLAARVKLSRPGGFLVGGPGTSPRLRWAELGVDLAAAAGGLDVAPILRLYDGALGGPEALLSELTRGPDGFTAPPLLAPLLDALLGALTRTPGAAHPAVVTLGQLLQGLELAVPAAVGFDLSADGLTALLAQPGVFLRDRLSAALADPVRRAAVFGAARSLLGLDLDALQRRIAANTPEAAWLPGLGLALAALGLATGPAGAVPIPDPAGILRLLADPGAALTGLATAALADEARRLDLLHRLRTTLGLDDLASPGVTHTLGPIALTTTSAGRISLALVPAAVRLGDYVALAASLTLDLAARTLDLAVELRPERLPLGVAVVRSFTVAAGQAPADGGLRIKLALGDPALAPASVQLYPPPADLPTRLGKLGAGFALSSLLGAALAHFGARQHAGVALLLRQLDLVDQAAADAPFRLRPLGPLLDDPAGHMRRAFLTGNAPNYAKLADLIKGLGMLQGAADGSLPLPWGVVVTAEQAGGVTRLRVRKQAAPNAVPPQVDLDLELALAAGADPVPGAAIALKLPGIPQAWDPLLVTGGFQGGQPVLAIGTTGARIDILPFKGWDAALMQLAQVGVYKLLPTLLTALFKALKFKDPGLVDKVDDLGQALGLQQQSFAPGADVLTEIKTDPAAWIKKQFDNTNAPTTVGALYDLIHLTGSAAVTRVGDLITVTIGDLTIEIGRSADADPTKEKIGAWVRLPKLNSLHIPSASPIVGLRLAAGVFVTDASNEPQLDLTIAVGLVDDILKIAGITLLPGIEAAYAGPAKIQDINAFSASLLLQVNGVDDFKGLRLRALPAFSVARMTDAVSFGPAADQPPSAADILALVRAGLIPLAIEMLLQNSSVQTGFINKDFALPGGRLLKPGNALRDSGLITADFKHLTNLALLTPQGVIGGLLYAAMDVLASSNSPAPLVPIEAGGLYVAKDATGGLGLRFQIPALTLSRDPEVVLVLGDDAAWAKSHGYAGTGAGGLGVFFVRKNGAVITLTEPSFELLSVGVDVRGKNHGQLFELAGISLDGFAARIYVGVGIKSGAATVKWGAFARLIELGLPLGGGSGGSNPVAQSMLAPSGGEKGAVNPTFDIGVGYLSTSSLFVQLGDDPSKNELWFPIQRSFGPLHIQQIGVAWKAPTKQLGLFVDGGASLAGLTVQVDDLGVWIPVTDPGNGSKWALELKGLGVGYENDSVRIAGALVKADTAPGTTQYIGGFVVEAMSLGLTGFGSYAEVAPAQGDKFTALFVYIFLKAPLGGPPFFFVTGLAGGFGYNMGLEVPAIDKVREFPFVAAAMNPATITNDPVGAMKQLQTYIPIERGSYWIAAGVKFNSFQLIDSFALLHVMFGNGLEVGLLGLSRMQLPPAVPLVSIEMALKVLFSTRKGLLSVEAQLTDNSWLLGKACRLTGGFAYYYWFGGGHSGDFVISLGGYHPRFAVPAHYPTVPRLGFNWHVSSAITVKGEAYFALTPSCVMAGGLLEAVFQAGDLRAWFKAWADFLISWKPFHYDIEIGISVGVKYGWFGIELGCRLAIWGPDFTGEVEVDWFIISFTIPIGANASRNAIPKLTWGEFREQFLPADKDMVGLDAVVGLIDVRDKDDPNKRTLLLGPEFALRTRTPLATNAITLGAAATFVVPAPDDAMSPRPLVDARAKSSDPRLDVDIRPMQVPDVTASHVVKILDKNGVDRTNQFPDSAITLIYDGVPAALWDFEAIDMALAALGVKSPEAKTVPSLVGVQLRAQVETLVGSGDIPVVQWEMDPIHKNPLTAPRIQPKPTGNVLVTLGVNQSTQVFVAASRLLSGAGFQGRRSNVLAAADAEGVVVPLHPELNVSSARLARRRTAPPAIVSLDDSVAAVAAAGTAARIQYRSPVAPQAKVRPPELRGVVQRAAAPTLSQGRGLRTTVGSVAGITAATARKLVSSGARTPIAGATLLRSAPPKANQPTRVAAKARQVVAGPTATAGQRAEFKRLQKIGVRNQAIDPRDLVAGTSGTSIAAGTTQLWDFPTRGAAAPGVTVTFSGNQGLRITSLDRAGELLTDVETLGSGTYVVPKGAARVAVSGLGKVTPPAAATPSMGNLTLKQSARGPAVVGWLGTSELVRLAEATYLARGAVLRTQAPAERTQMIGLVRASDALRGQIAVETALPRACQTIAVIVERVDPKETMLLGNGANLSVIGATLSAEPARITSGTRAILLYAVQALDPAESVITVALSANPGWRLAGVLGMGGAPGRWAQALAQEAPERLVDDAPLSTHGQSVVAFVVK